MAAEVDRNDTVFAGEGGHLFPQIGTVAGPAMNEDQRGITRSRAVIRDRNATRSCRRPSGVEARTTNEPERQVTHEEQSEDLPQNSGSDRP